MSKRTARSLPSTPKQKRSKLTGDQLLLDQFFSKSPEKGTHFPSPRVHNVSKDEKYAAELLEQDDIELETVRLREVTWTQAKPRETQAEDEASVLPSGSHSAVRAMPETTGNICDDAVNLTPRVLELPKTIDLASEPFQPPEYMSFAADPLEFNLHREPWPAGMAAPYGFLAHILATLSGTRSRISIINTLTNALRTLTVFHPPSLLPALYLLSNTLSPSYTAVELGLGPSIISKAIQHVSGLGYTSIKRLYNLKGDVGDVAFEAKSNLRTLIPHPPLLINNVYTSLLKIANTKGPGSMKQKQALVEKLLVAARGEETRFLTRTLAQNLRVGALRTSILTALARSMVLTPPPAALPQSQSLYHNFLPLIYDEHRKTTLTADMKDQLKLRFSRAEKVVMRVYVQHPNYADIVGALLATGLDNLVEHVPLTIGIPLHPTLGSPIRSIDEIYQRLGDLPFAAELKYDGQRAQIHGLRREDGQVIVHIFSRHLEDMTTKYPDVLSLICRIFEDSPQTTSFIIDSEIVALDPSDGTLRSFQELSNRARKDVQLQNVTIMVGVFAFDLMYLDGEILLQQPFRQRRAILRSRFPPVNLDNVSQFKHVDNRDSEDGRDGMEELWGKSLYSKCEGLMIKLLDHGEVPEDATIVKEKNRKKPLPATYEPDKRTFAWLKLKKDYVLGLGDSLDLVPIGAWHGNGRKARWWSPVLLAIWDAASNRLVAVCKCMSGFSDEFYKAMAARYPENSDTCSPLSLWQCETGGLRPEVYFKPQEVWEIRGADVTLSPVSVAALGLVSDSRGLSLRFPRFIRSRTDKSIEQASTADFLAQIWQSQQGKGKKQGGVDDVELVDVDLEEGLDLEEEDLFDYDDHDFLPEADGLSRSQS